MLVKLWVSLCEIPPTPPPGLVDKVEPRNSWQTKLHSIQPEFSKPSLCVCFAGAIN